MGRVLGVWLGFWVELSGLCRGGLGVGWVCVRGRVDGLGGGGVMIHWTSDQNTLLYLTLPYH